MLARIVSGVIGIFMLFNALTWLFDPYQAAKGLSMALLDGEGGNTQIGDFTSFFFTAGLMAIAQKAGNLTTGVFGGGLAMALEILRLWVFTARSLEFPRKMIW